MSPHDFGDMHESALIFVPVATFGQLIAKCEKRVSAAVSCQRKVETSEFG
jgi:hypothetical protein